MQGGVRRVGERERHRERRRGQGKEGREGEGEDRREGRKENVFPWTGSAGSLSLQRATDFTHFPLCKELFFWGKASMRGPLFFLPTCSVKIA